jgi:hypothetical protein
MGVKALFILPFIALLMFPASAGDDGFVIAPRKDIKFTSTELSALVKKLKSQNLEEVRAAAIELSASQDAKAHALLSALYDGDAPRRLIAIRALSRLSLPNQAEGFFKVALADPYQAIRLGAAEQVRQLETAEKAAARFAKAANDEKMPLIYRYRALQAVSRVGGKDATAVLVAALQSPEPDLVIAAAEGLGMMGDLAQTATLIGALNSTDPEVKAAVADALERLTGQKFRFDLVAWTQWEKEQGGAAKKIAAASPSEAGEGGESPPPEVKPGVTDLVIVFDTTGSMLHIWPQVSGAIDAVLAELVKQAPSLRLGSVKYRAADPRMSLTYTIKPKALTRKHEEVRNDVQDATFGGGSGGLQLGLSYAINSMAWRMESRKIILLVGDTSPDIPQSSLQTIAEAAQMDGILVQTLYVRTTHGSEHFDTYKALALAGAGRFYEYNKAERHLVEMSVEKVDVKAAETPSETAKKWQTPRK